jgi:hypothetical protein
MTIGRQQRGQPLRHGHPSITPALGHGDVPLPLRLPDVELTSAEVHVRPLQREDLSTAQARVSTEQHHGLDAPVQLAGRLDQPLVLL